MRTVVGSPCGFGSRSRSVGPKQIAGARLGARRERSGVGTCAQRQREGGGVCVCRKCAPASVGPLFFILFDHEFLILAASTFDHTNNDPLIWEPSREMRVRDGRAELLWPVVDRLCSGAGAA